MLAILKAACLIVLASFMILDYNLKAKIKNGAYQSEYVYLADDKVKWNLKVCDMILGIILVLLISLLYFMPNHLGVDLEKVPKYILYIILLRYVVEYLTLKKYLVIEKAVS
ncbi:hypothetical protein [Enterococcus sp. CSURQ0835]|uniref:hypothetical protein n=1 Tax=Enterococcus sp. CSURQ0835 TaxID=2681394 RepID=UPI001359E310|nr:hypothetical protein [Enterococcus sp. CSURQ0835]